MDPLKEFVKYEQYDDFRGNNGQIERLKCEETLGEKEPIPEISLNFEEAWSKDRKSLVEFESTYKTIPLLDEDIKIINTMSSCTPDEVAKLIRGIQNSVYLLGLEEARQCRRGKILGVLDNDSEKDGLVRNYKK